MLAACSQEAPLPPNSGSKAEYASALPHPVFTALTDELRFTGVLKSSVTSPSVPLSLAFLGEGRRWVPAMASLLFITVHAAGTKAPWPE